jgi:hypothetical protein
MTTQYFSDSENGPRARINETISPVAWRGIAALVETLVADGSFGESFPDVCNDGGAIIGTNFHRWYPVMQAEVTELGWPLINCELPPTLAILDLIVFCHKYVSKGTPIPGGYHPYMNHQHLSFDRPTGQAEFRMRIETVLARNGLAYKLREDSSIVRLAPVILHEMLSAVTFQTGDGTLDSILESARTKFLNPDPRVRRESLEKLWDAWERLKTVEPGNDKKLQAKALLDQAATEPNFRAVLETEAVNLTAVGNNFLIRHTETNRTPIGSDLHVDYLFHRLFSLVWMLLKNREAQN